MKRALLLVIGTLCANAVSAAQLGRLFYTPAERAQLDAARTQKRNPSQAAATEAPPAPPAPQIITYSGIVRRSDGTSIVWLNNKPVAAKDALPGLALKGRIRPDGAVTLQVPETGARVELKVGQSAELQTGHVGEVRPVPPAGKEESVQAKPPAEESEKKADPSAASQLKTDRK